MHWLEFSAFPLWINLMIFAVAAAVVWIAGTRVSAYADVIADRTGVGKAFIGALLLGGVTSLPEGATTITASAIGNASLAVNNIVGGVAMQVAILAIADAFIAERPLSSTVRDPSILLEGALLVFVLALAVGGINVGDVLMFGVGIWSTAILLASLVAFYLLHQHGPRDTWEPEEPERPRHRFPGKRGGQQQNGASQYSTRRIVLYTIVASLVILVAGFTLARVGDVLAEQTGLGSSFVGAVLVAVSTSLPEISTTIAAVRLGQFAMAFSNIFGANILDMSVLFLADLVFFGGPVLNEVGRFTMSTTILGILITSVYLIGLLDRRKHMLMRLGTDSILVLVLYVGGIAVLYSLR